MLFFNPTITREGLGAVAPAFSLASAFSQESSTSGELCGTSRPKGHHLVSSET